MVASSSAGFFSSIRPRGRPLTKSTMSGRRVFLFSVTLNWLTASQSLLAGTSKSNTRTWSPRTLPSASRYSISTPFTSIRWKVRLRALTVEPSGRVSFRKASSSAPPGRPLFSAARASHTRRSKYRPGRSRARSAVWGIWARCPRPWATRQPRLVSHVEGGGLQRRLQ